MSDWQLSDGSGDHHGGTDDDDDKEEEKEEKAIRLVGRWWAKAQKSLQNESAQTQTTTHTGNGSPAHDCLLPNCARPERTDDDRARHKVIIMLR